MTETTLERDWRELGFDLRLCSHYHLERKRFFDWWNHVSAFLAVLLGSATAVALLATNPKVAMVVAIAVTVIQGFNLVIGFSRQAWTHGDLYRQFIDLEIDWMKAEPSVKALSDLGAARRALEKTEPTPMPYLIRRCHIDIMRRDGNPKSEWPRLGFWQRAFANYLSG